MSDIVKGFPPLSVSGDWCVSAGTAHSDAGTAGETQQMQLAQMEKRKKGKHKTHSNSN
ncbi:MAG: hypothetical protein ACLSFT_02775 [Ruminococcus callidus]